MYMYMYIVVFYRLFDEIQGSLYIYIYIYTCICIYMYVCIYIYCRIFIRAPYIYMMRYRALDLLRLSTGDSLYIAHIPSTTPNVSHQRALCIWVCSRFHPMNYNALVLQLPEETERTSRAPHPILSNARQKSPVSYKRHRKVFYKEYKAKRALYLIYSIRWITTHFFYQRSKKELFDETQGSFVVLLRGFLGQKIWYIHIYICVCI